MKIYKSLGLLLGESDFEWHNEGDIPAVTWQHTWEAIWGHNCYSHHLFHPTPLTARACFIALSHSLGTENYCHGCSLRKKNQHSSIYSGFNPVRSAVAFYERFCICFFKWSIRELIVKW